MPIAAMSWGRRPGTSPDSQKILPEVGAVIPAIRLSMVVLPEPFGPKMPTISPRLIANETSDTAVSPPNRLVRPTTLSAYRAGGGSDAPLTGLDTFTGADASDRTALPEQGSRNAPGHDQNGENQNGSVYDRPNLASEVDDVWQS